MGSRPCPGRNESGAPRRGQLGLRGSILAHYTSDWIVSIEDITEFVADQHRHIESDQLSLLETPHEAVYPVSEALASQTGWGWIGLGENHVWNSVFQGPAD